MRLVGSDRVRADMRHALLLSFVAACQAAEGPGAPDAGPDVHPDAASGGPDAPRILSLATNVTAVMAGENEILIVTAIVTDPDGIDDLIGGTLHDPISGRSYGAFATSAAEGAYEIRLRWNEINAVAPIDAPTGGAVRTFRAAFYDQAGHIASSDAAITFTCGARYGICDGECKDLETDDANCGACRNRLRWTESCVQGMATCDPGNRTCSGVCVARADVAHCGGCGHACPAPPAGLETSCRPAAGSDECILDEERFTQRASCDAQCAPPYDTCLEASYYYENGGVGYFVHEACSWTPPAMISAATFGHAECTCGAS